MSLIARASTLALVASSLVLLAPACSGTPPSSGFTGGNHGGNSGGGNGNGNGSGSGDDDGGGTGNGSGTFGDGGFAGDSGGLSGDAGCATGSFTGTKQPVYMLFVLDGSGSMAQNNKWTAVVPALQSIFTDMNTKADPGIAAGLIVFSDTQDSTCGGFQCSGPYPGSKDVPIGFVGSAQLTSLKNRLSGMPMDGTPTGTAMTGAYTELENYMPTGSNPPPGGKKVMVLITDGVPTDNCAQNGGSYSSNACVTMAASKLAEAAPKGPIETFVIGVGQFPSTDTTNFDPSFLGYVAQSGGSGPKGCNPAENSNVANVCYFEVDPTTGSASQLQQNFENAINAIRGQVASCTISLSGNNNVDPSKVNVTINGMTIPQDPTNGWTYDNPAMPTSITLHGMACMDLQNNPMASVQIILGCKTITPM